MNKEIARRLGTSIRNVDEVLRPAVHPKTSYQTQTAPELRAYALENGPGCLSSARPGLIFNGQQRLDLPRPDRARLRGGFQVLQRVLRPAARRHSDQRRLGAAVSRPAKSVATASALLRSDVTPYTSGDRLQ